MQDAVITTPNGENLPVTALHGTELAFTITPEEGFVVTEVKVNGETVEAVEGVYTVVVTAIVNIDVTTQEESTVPAEPTIATSIKVGDKVILASVAKKVEFSGISTTSTIYGLKENYEGNVPEGIEILEIVAGSDQGSFAFKMSDGRYLNWSSGNSLSTATSISKNSSWTVEFDGDIAIIKNVGDSTRQIKYNSSASRFACYTSGQTAVNLFIVG